MNLRRQHKTLAAVIVALGVGTMVFAASPPVIAAAQSLEGSWHAETYELAGGQVHDIDGMIYFTGSDWTVLFFVFDAEGQPARGSAEGGTFTLEGDKLTFRHHYNLSGGAALPGLPASDWRMQVRSAADAGVESATVDVSGDRLTIYFPSGNRMTFGRSS